jgi:hypothetical protein
MCHNQDRTLQFDWKKLDQSLSRPMKQALCALYFDGDLYLEQTWDGAIYKSPAEVRFGVTTVRGLQSRWWVEATGRGRLKFLQMTLSPAGRMRMTEAKEPCLGHA